jgi:hypothetical protein
MKRKQFSRRAAAALAWMAFTFAGLQIGYQVVVDAWFPRLYDREADYRYRELTSLVKAEAQRPLLVVLGSSRTSMSFHPQAVGPLTSGAEPEPIAYNFSHLGASSGWSCIQLQRLIASGLKPKWVVVEVVTPNLCHDANNVVAENGVLFEIPQLLRYVSARTFFRNFLVRRLIPWHRNRTDLLLAVAPGWVDDEASAIRKIEFEPLGWDDRFAKRLRIPDDLPRYFQQSKEIYETHLRSFHINERLARPLDDIAALCRREGVEVAFVMTPESSEFRSWYGPGAEEKIVQFRNDFEQRTGHTIIDARAWLPDDAFYDGHHVLHAGADMFTQRLAEDVLRPLVNGTRPKVPAVLTSRPAPAP